MVVEVAVIALLRLLHDTVAAARQGTAGGASVVVGLVAIVAGFDARPQHAIAAAGRHAISLAAVVGAGVAVVALLAFLQHAVAANRQCAAVAAGVGRVFVAVVALLAVLDHTIAAARELAGVAAAGGDDDVNTAFAGFTAIAALGDEGPAAVIEALRLSGLRGRGGAGFPAHVKWQAVANHRGENPVVVCNADEGEPGTFKDRAIALLRPMLLLEGLAIAAHTVGASEVILYLRGEQGGALASLQRALASLRAAGHLADLSFEIALGHGAYICGEETALLEALEGRRGMPRHKPPFPTDAGYLGRPTLLSNVETFASVPAIVRRGGAWYAGLGKDGAAGMRLFSVSGDVARPGVYELPLGTTLRELVAAAGGIAHGRQLQAFVPGGAASGVLHARHQDVALDAVALSAVGSMAGSAGVIVLDERRDVAELVGDSLRFFRDESCGQCAPCRVGTQVLSQAFADYRAAARNGGASAQQAQQHLAHVAEEVGWEMSEGSICGLGQAAHLPLAHFLREFAG